MRLLDRYLLRQLPLPFFVGLGCFVCIMLAEVAWRISGALIGSGISAATLAQFFFYSAPRAAVWSAPVGLLVAVSMAMTSLERRGEVTAMRAAGASLCRIELPWLIVGALVAALAVWANQTVVPKTTERSYQLFTQMTFQVPVVKEAWHQLFRSPNGDLFYVRRMNATQGKLEGITIWQRGQNGFVRRLIVAKSARVVDKQWVLEDGYVRDFDELCRPKGLPRVFTRLPISMWAAIQEYYADKRTPYEMSITELGQLARALEAGGKDARQLLVHLHFKYSIPCAAAVFVLVAAPLAHRYARLGTFAGLVLAIVILFLYNGVRSWTLALGLAGSLAPWVAGWLPNLLFGAIGAVLFLRQE
jgi:lipopolysaccharide export system permease protein